MRTGDRRRWVVGVFIVIGVLVALFFIVRDLGSGEEPEQTGTLMRLDGRAIG